MYSLSASSLSPFKEQILNRKPTVTNKTNKHKELDVIVEISCM